MNERRNQAPNNKATKDEDLAALQAANEEQSSQPPSKYDRNKKTANAIIHATLKFADEILGHDVVVSLLETYRLYNIAEQYPPDNTDLILSTEEYARIIQAIESHPEGWSALYEIGRRTFQHTQRQHEGIYKLAGVAMRYMPADFALNQVLAAIVRALTATNPTVVAWHEKIATGKYLYAEKTCAMCYGRRSTGPVCTMYCGFLSEAALWATGKHYSVIEVRCIAQGDSACEFIIE